MTVVVYCGICRRELDPTAATNWHRVVGWERRGQSGGSDIALREKVDVYAHHACVRLAKAGIDPGQGTLGGMDDAA